MKFIYLIIIILLLPSIIILKAIDGKGTKDDPYQITTINEFQNIIDQKKNIYYILMNDIDASETRNWNVGDHDGNPNTPDEPMGFIPIIYFMGNLDGQGHVISNLYINIQQGFGNIGLFACFGLGGYIRRLGIENCDITGFGNVGSLCGYCENGLITECYTTGSVNSIDTNSNNTVGGFCGVNNRSPIENCYTSCTTSSLSTKSDYIVAGFCNASRLPFVDVVYCYSIGKITSSKKIYIFSELENARYCFWDVETTGIPDTGGNEAKGLPTSEMKKKATYSIWDFDRVWCIDEGKDYPNLRAFGKCPPTDVPQEPKEIENKIEVLPNPATDKITIEFPSEFMSNARVSIFSCLGIELLTQNTFNKRFEFDCFPLPNGIYFCVVKSGSKAYSGKFVVVK